MKKIIILPKKCLYCGQKFTRDSCKRLSDFKSKKFCSHKCFTNYNVGKKHSNFSGGVKHRPDGYLRDSKTDKYIHRIVMEKHLKRKLTSKENIHHVDGDVTNNNITNLKLYVSNSEHRKYEASIAPRNIFGQFCRKENPVMSNKRKKIAFITGITGQ